MPDTDSKGRTADSTPDDRAADPELDRRMAELAVEFVHRDDLSPERRSVLRRYLAELPDRFRTGPSDTPVGVAALRPRNQEPVQIELQDARHQEARLAVVAGYERAVEILSPGPGRAGHAELAWFEEGAAECREMAGLPRAHARPLFDNVVAVNFAEARS
jgi:hypothetical protein